MENPVQAEAHLEVLLVWLDVDVAGLAFHRLGKNVVDQFDNGCLTGLVQQILAHIQLGEQVLAVFFLTQVLNDLLGSVIGLTVGAIYG